MKQSAENEIRSFVNEVTRQFDPERIILFGSHAAGNMTLDSDVDLLVVMHFEGRPHQQVFKIRKSIKRSFPLDLLVRRPEDIEHRLKMGDFFLAEIMQKGKVLYERPGKGMDQKSRR